MTTTAVPTNNKPRQTSPRPRHLVWWLAPWSLIAMSIIPTVLLAYTTSAGDYLKYWRYPKYVTGKTVVWVLALAFAMAVGMWIVARERRHNGERLGWDLTLREQKVMRVCFVQLSVITVIGYAIWLALGTANGFSFGQLEGVGSTYDPTQAQQQFEGVSGVTTMTQFGIATAIVGVLLWPYARKWERVFTIAVIAAGPVRALMVSERLAAVEILIPVGVLVLARIYMSASTTSWKRWLIRIVPLLALPALIVGFTAYESTRSWPWYRDHTSQTNLWSFGAHRLVGYYSTAYGNAELLRDGAWPQPGALPYVTVSFFWSAPVIGNLVPYRELTGDSYGYRNYQAQIRVTNREFNNSGGITAFTMDYGVAGGLVAAALFGALMGAGYAAFEGARRWGLLVYPVFVAGMLELSRVFYLGAGRTAPALAGVLYVVFRLRKARRQDLRWGTGPRPKRWANLPTVSGAGRPAEQERGGPTTPSPADVVSRPSAPASR